MATATIGQLTLVGSAAAGDLIEIETVGGVSRAITKANYIGATLTGGGTLALGANTLTVPASGVAALKSGTPTAGNLAGWADANNLSDGNFALSDIARLSQGNSFALAVTGAAGFRTFFTGALNSDTFYDFPIVTQGAMIVSAISGGSNALRYLLAAFRANSSPNMSAISIGSDFLVSTATPTGTTGTNGKATISCTNGHIYVENRLGAAVSFSVTLFL